MLYALGAAALAAFAVVVTTAAVVIGQRDENARTKAEFETYKIESAVLAEALKKQTAEAQLKTEQLRKDLGPRQLNKQKFAELIAEVEPPKEGLITVWYFADDSECFALAEQIEVALMEANWPTVSPISFKGSNSPDPSAMSLDGMPYGVTLVARDISRAEQDATHNRFEGRPWVKTPYTVLAHALSESLGKLSAHLGGPNAASNELRIIVAPR